MAVRRDYAEAGCLMAYGSPIRDNYRQAADYVAEILRGVKPAELKRHDITLNRFGIPKSVGF